MDIEYNTSHCHAIRESPIYNCDTYKEKTLWISDFLKA